MTDFSPRYEHVLLHRLWLFAKLRGDLSPSEHVHVIECADCGVALRACLNSETFGAVLVQLGREEDGEIGRAHDA